MCSAASATSDVPMRNSSSALERVDCSRSGGKKPVPTSPARERAPAESAAGSPCRELASANWSSARREQRRVAVEVGEAGARRAGSAFHVDRGRARGGRAARSNSGTRPSGGALTASSSVMPSAAEDGRVSAAATSRPSSSAAASASCSSAPRSRSGPCASSSAARATACPSASAGARSSSTRLHELTPPLVELEHRVERSAAPLRASASRTPSGRRGSRRSSTPEPSGQFTSRCARRARNCATPSSFTGGRPSPPAERSLAFATQTPRPAHRQVASFSPSPKVTLCAAVNPRRSPRNATPDDFETSGARTRGRSGATSRRTPVGEPRPASRASGSSPSSPTVTSFVVGSESHCARSPTTCSSTLDVAVALSPPRSPQSRTARRRRTRSLVRSGRPRADRLPRQLDRDGRAAASAPSASATSPPW